MKFDLIKEFEKEKKAFEGSFTSWELPHYNMSTGYLLTIVRAEGQADDDGIYRGEINQIDKIFPDLKTLVKFKNQMIYSMSLEGYYVQKNVWYGHTLGITNIYNRDQLWAKTNNKEVNYRLDLYLDLGHII